MSEKLSNKGVTSYIFILIITIIILIVLVVFYLYIFSPSTFYKILPKVPGFS